MSKTVHFVYPFDDKRIAAPWSIGNELSLRMRNVGYTVHNYNWALQAVIVPRPGDILIGHPHPGVGVFNSSLCGPWSKRIAIQPIKIGFGFFAQMDFLNTCCDHVCYISGKHWFDYLPQSFRKKAVRLDMAINWDSWPMIKDKFHAPRKRNLLYIGHTLEMKNCDALARIARHLKCEFPKMKCGHIGAGEIGYFENYGYFDSLLDPKCLKILKQYDFAISASTMDANATTILEETALGLCVFANKESGWLQEDTISCDSEDNFITNISAFQKLGSDEIKHAVFERRNRMKEAYTFDNMFAKILQLLHNE